MIRKCLLGFTALAFVAMPQMTKAQSSSINTFSPYTFHGLGDLSIQGVDQMRSMGGSGVAFHSPFVINYLNPASYGSVVPKSFIFNVGMEGLNTYLQEETNGQTKKTSFNTFNVRDVAIMFPLAKKVGFSLSVTPYSNVGYRVKIDESNQSIIANLGRVQYLYEGEGGLAQIKAGVGVGLFKDFSVGAEAIYYTGATTRYFGIDITPITSSMQHNSMTASYKQSVSKIIPAIGFQWDVVNSPKRIFTIGGTYKFSSKLNPTTTRFIPSNNMYQDTVNLTSYSSDFKMAAVLNMGVAYQSDRINVTADYVNENWGAVNKNEPLDIGTYRNTNSYRAGIQYTPNRMDIRRFLNRWSYRAGFRYSDYYMKINGHNISEKAVSFGVGIPMKYGGLSNINVGLELGQRGSLKPGLIKNNYWKITVGVSLFGDDYWFIKPKYD